MTQPNDWPEVQICYVLPCGTATLPFKGGTITCRVAVGHLDTPETGLIDEMRGGREPTPWRSAEIREEALATVGNRADLDETMKRRLLSHLRRTPWYE